MNSAPLAKLGGSFARFTNQDGVAVKCWVNGFRPSVSFKDGSSGPAFKITPGHCVGQNGTRNIWTFNSAPILVKAERVTDNWNEKPEERT